MRREATVERDWPVRRFCRRALVVRLFGTSTENIFWPSPVKVVKCK
jgi:hypothetical protein